MCPGATDAPAVAKFAYSHKQKQKKKHFYEQRAITLEVMRCYGLF